MLRKWITKWTAEYLYERKQRVKANDTISEWKKVEAGVIQGSLLGPILFLLVKADINSFLPESTNLQKFADDLLTYKIIFNRNCDNTQQAVDSINKWAEDNKMRLNNKITKHIFIHSNSNEQHITLNGKKLGKVENYKYLSVIINNEPNHDIHWDKVSKTTNSQKYQLKHHEHLKQLKFKEEILINVYRSLTLSHSTYSAPLLISTSKNVKREMAKQQHRFLKIIGLTRHKHMRNIIYLQSIRTWKNMH